LSDRNEKKDGQSNPDTRQASRAKSLRRPQTGQKGAALYESIKQHQSIVIQQISRNRAEQMAYYRYLENEQVSVSELVASLAEHCQESVSGKHVLAISDTSEINLNAHRGRLNPEGVGVVGNNRDVGFFIHPTLVLSAEDRFPLGLSHVQMWTRAMGRGKKKSKQTAKQPIESKESYKWIASAEHSQCCFQVGDAQLVTHIGNREADLYEDGQPFLMVDPNSWTISSTE
jgi:hypothetical protein